MNTEGEPAQPVAKLKINSLNAEFFMEKNKSVGRFTVCEDFWRLNHLKCKAPESIQAKREPNPSEQTGNLTKAVFQNLQKKLDIQAK